MIKKEEKLFSFAEQFHAFHLGDIIETFFDQLTCFLSGLRDPHRELVTLEVDQVGI